MKSTMEEQKETSPYLYEDKHVFLTKENELFLKDGTPGDQTKVGEIAEDEVEQKIAELKNRFEELQAKVTRLLEEGPAPATLASLDSEIRETVFIGSAEDLLVRLEEAQQDSGKVDTSGVEEETESSVDEEATGDESDPSEDPVVYYRDIVSKAQELAKQTDWPYVSMELDNLSREWSDGPETDSDEVKELFAKFNDAVKDFEKRKEEHYEELNKQREKNLETKKRLLEEFEGIISNKTWTATRRVNQIKGQWNSIGALPSGKGDGWDERFEELLEIFNDHKVDRLVQQRQKREDNLMVKLTVLEKMERVTKSIDHETDNWDEIDENFEALTKQWKKIGRVPKEKADDVWGRYKSVQDDFYDLKYRYNPEHQSKVDKFSTKKERLCEEAEALLEADDLAIAARKINKLHRRWKKIGNLPQRTEDKLWARFKSATDAFNELKSKNQDKIKEQEEQHYQQKLDLIDQANAIKDTDDFDKGHSRMQNLMDRWKKIGPVARKKSNKIWKQFKGAMDEFYDRRREHFKEVKEQRKENLEEKKEILDKLHELGRHEDPIEAVEIAKGLQEKFKEAGYVPIKQKNKMWKQYREACDVIYDRFRAAKSGDKFDQELAKADLDTDERQQIQKLRKEFKKVEKEARALKEEVLNFKEKKTYFSPSSGGNSLLDQVNEKIHKAEAKLKQKQQKMDALTQEMDDIRAEAE
ncbi:DUF349 domain-containing protein [Fodinibius sediminis]|uniref:DUF349 domain-containing protein n=1 Tax=Fodinibius sediminis TaxID=1214077 RepID=A0A521AGK1_9BACT|nr:DUF349 domain-containing protein [Fodinibius sediminis]SMO33830.1 protein of unknown function [Fodinibius sediminis]